MRRPSKAQRYDDMVRGCEFLIKYWGGLRDQALTKKKECKPYMTDIYQKDADLADQAVHSYAHVLRRANVLSECPCANCEWVRSQPEVVA